MRLWKVCYTFYGIFKFFFQVILEKKLKALAFCSYINLSVAKLSTNHGTTETKNIKKDQLS